MARCRPVPEPKPASSPCADHTPGIQRSAVVGQAEADGNEAVIAFVVQDAAHPPDEAALKEHLREHLAPYKRPSRIIAIDELPVNANGKVMKRELQARLANA